MEGNPYLGHDPDADPQRLRVLRAGQRRLVRDIARLEVAKARLEARLLKAYAGLAGMTQKLGKPTHPARAERGIAIAERAVRAELSQRLRVSDRAVAGRMGNAVTVTDFPLVMQAYAAGRIAAGHVWAMTRAAEPLRAREHRDAFEEQVVPYALSHSVSRTKRFAKRVAERLAEPPVGGSRGQGIA